MYLGTCSSGAKRVGGLCCLPFAITSFRGNVEHDNILRLEGSQGMKLDGDMLEPLTKIFDTKVFCGVVVCTNCIDALIICYRVNSPDILDTRAALTPKA